jgi:hypothetical protein
LTLYITKFAFFAKMVLNIQAGMNYFFILQVKVWGGY